MSFLGLTDLVADITVKSLALGASATIAKELVKGVFKGLSSKVLARFKPAAQEKALTDVVTSALRTAFEPIQIAPEDLPLAQAAIGRWAADANVHKELAALLQAHPEEPDLDMLWASWYTAGAHEWLEEPEFKLFFIRFVLEFTNGASKHPDLQSALGIQLLQGISATLRSSHDAVLVLAQEAERIAQASERSAETLYKMLQRQEERRLPNQEEAQLDSLEQNYRDALRRRFSKLEYGSMEGRPVAVEMSDVYIPLHVIEASPDRAEAFDIEERRAMALADANPDQAMQAMRRADQARQVRLRTHTTERRRLDDVLKSARSLVLLGDPGSGKSTALQHHALTCLTDPQGPLPVFLPLSAYDEHLKHDGSAVIFNFIEHYHEVHRHQSGLGPLFRRRFEQGQLLLLLDGLDEVVERPTRSFVSSQVMSLVAEAAINGSRVIVSSRFVGYREAPVTGVPEFAVCDLSMDDIENFARRFSESVARVLQRDTAQTQEDREALLRDVRSKPGVRDLAGNPLLLTQLALLRRDVGVLPDKRVLLYNRFLEKLLAEWRFLRSQGARRDAEPEMDTTRVQAALIHLAFVLHREWASGTAPKGLVLSVLGEALQDLGEPDPRREAERLLKDVRQRAGVLVERGHDSFGFLHLTFEEFLAGRALARMDPQDRWDFLRLHLHEPRWREPLFLALGWLGLVENRAEQGRDLLTRVLNARSDHEDLLHRDLFLAADLAAEEGPYGSVRDFLVERLASLLMSEVPFVQEEAVQRLAALARVGSSAAQDVLCGLPMEPDTLRMWNQIGSYLAAPGCSRLRGLVRANIVSGAGGRWSTILASTLVYDLDDLDLLVHWARQEGVSQPETWSIIAQHVHRAPRIRTVLLDELRNPEGSGPRIEADLFRDDPEFCRLLIAAWGRQKDAYYGDLAVELGHALCSHGIPVQWVLDQVRVYFDNNNSMLGLLKAYAQDAEVHAFVREMVFRGAGPVSLTAYEILVQGASFADLQQFVAHADGASADERGQWALALLQVSGSTLAKETLDRWMGSLNTDYKDWILRARVPEFSDTELASFYSLRSPFLRHVFIEEVEKRPIQGAINAALLACVSGPQVVGIAEDWVWPPMRFLASTDRRARAVLINAAQSGNGMANRALALACDLENDVRVSTFAELGELLLPTLIEGGQSLIELFVCQEGALQWLEGLEEHFFPAILSGFMHVDEIREGKMYSVVLRRLFAHWGVQTLEFAKDETVRAWILGSSVDLLSVEQTAELNALAAGEKQGRLGPFISLPSVRESIINGVRHLDPGMFRWAPLMGAGIHDIAGITGAIRDACLSDSFELRATALYCLGLQRQMDRRDLQLMCRGLEDPRQDVRRVAVRVLAQNVGGRGVASALKRDLNDACGEVRQIAALALAEAGKLCSTERVAWLGMDCFVAWQELSGLCESEQRRRRLAATLAQDIVRRGRLRADLEEILLEPSWSRRQGAAFALAQAGGGRRLVDILLERVSDTRDIDPDGLQISCARLLLGSSEAKSHSIACESLIRGLRASLRPWQDQFDAVDVRYTAAAALGSGDLLLRHDEVISALQEALHDPHPDVRTQAWKALSRVLTAPTSLSTPT